MNNSIMRAEINPKNMLTIRFKIFFCIIHEILAIIFIIGGFEKNYATSLGYVWYNWYGFDYAFSVAYSGGNRDIIPNESNLNSDMFWIPFLALCLVFIIILCLPVIYNLIIKLIANIINKNYSLLLNDNEIKGTYKNKFSRSQLVLPINQINSISKKKGLLDRLLGGETIIIATASEKIKFPTVKNAVEFVDKASNMLSTKSNNTSIEPLDTIEKTTAAVTDNTFHSADEISKFKKLLDDGVITQEEFDAKKTQLLGL